jgi:S-adenosylmethionine decarboxylase proenzyme
MDNYHLIDKGTHIIIDIYEISNNDILKYSNSIIDILNKITNKFKLNVVNKAIHQFEPFGVTGVYVLAESHLSIHTFVEERKVAMDLYTCRNLTDTNNIINYIKDLFGICKINYKVIDR